MPVVSILQGFFESEFVFPSMSLQVIKSFLSAFGLIKREVLEQYGRIACSGMSELRSFICLKVHPDFLLGEKLRLCWGQKAFSYGIRF